MSECKHGLLKSCCDDCKNDALEVAKRVYASLENEGFYGPYVLGETLWDEFKETFKDA